MVSLAVRTVSEWLWKQSRRGWYPDVVVSHSGWGCGLDVSWVFPKARRLSYLEWWFCNEADEYGFDPGNKWWDYNDIMRFKLRRRNLTLALELSEAHSIVSQLNGRRLNYLHCFNLNVR